MLPKTASPARRCPQGERAGGQQRKGDLDQPVKTELLEDAGVEHRRRRGGGPVAKRGPGVHRPERDEDAEPKEEEAEDVRLGAGGERVRRKDVPEGDHVETPGAALHVDRDQPEQREHRPGGEVDRHLHRRVDAVPSSPDPDHDEGRDQRQLVEEVEEEKIHARERPHQPGEHDKQEHEVDLEPLGAGADGAEARGEADQPGQDEERHRDPVDAQLKRDPDAGQARRVLRQEGVSVDLRHRGVMPPDMQRHEEGRRKAEIREPHRPALRQAEADRKGDRQRRGDGYQQGVEWIRGHGR